MLAIAELIKAEDDGQEDLSKVHQKFVAALEEEGLLFRRGFLKFVSQVLGSVSDAQVRKWIAEKDLQGFLAHAREYLDEFASQIPRTFKRAARDEIERLSQPGLFGLGKERMEFDPGNKSTVKAIERSKLNLIREITAKQKEAIRAAINDSIERGSGPIDAARTFRNAIGLTENQYRAVNNYRNLLERGSFEAMSRELRDKRFDRTVNRAISAVERGDANILSKDQIDKMVLRYAENMRRYRAETIARTETMRTMNLAKQESFKQMADQLGIDYADVERTWVATLDNRTRDTHAEMNRQMVVGIETPFESPSGEELMYPGDPMASGEEVINCRCTMVVKFPWNKMRFNKAFNPDEPRDSRGRWTTSGSSSGATKKHLFGKDSDFEEINNNLRDSYDRKIPKAIQEKIDAIDADFAENGRPVPEGTKLYRVLSFDSSDPLLKRFEAGKGWEDQAYMATTSDKKYAESIMSDDLDKTAVMLHVDPSKKTNPIALYNPEESEYVFERGSRFSVRSVERSQGRLDVHVLLTRLKPSVAKAFNPDEPRDDHGRWTSDSARDWDIYAAISNYGNHSHMLVNGYLRGGDFRPTPGSVAEDDVNNIVAALDQGFKGKIAKTMAKDMTLYRGVESSALYKKLKGSVGKTFVDKGFISTSRVQAIAGHASDYGDEKMNVMLEIQAKKGTRYLTGRQDEKELLLNRSTKFKVISAKEDFWSKRGYQGLRVKMRIVK